MRRSSLALVLLLYAFCGPLPAYAANQCSCPSIAADGKGNSSCNATETGSRCTIDFNRFPPPFEELARDSLNEIGASGAQSPILFPPETVTAVEVDQQESAIILRDIIARGGENQALVDTLMVYLTVAVASREDGTALFKEHMSFFVELYAWLDANEEILRTAFIPPTVGSTPEVTRLGGQDGGGLTVQVALGCIEARSGGIWVMYKAFWSPSSSIGQCL